MNRIKLPEDYSEITYDQGESYGSGQVEVLEWVGAGLGCVGTVAGIGTLIHRARYGYWVWDRQTANFRAMEKEALGNMTRKHKRAYSHMGARMKRHFVTLDTWEEREWCIEDMQACYKKNLPYLDFSKYLSHRAIDKAGRARRVHAAR